MSRDRFRSPRQPSRCYAFVVFALATFLALFVVCRSPALSYRVQAELVAYQPASATSAEEAGRKYLAALKKEWLDSAFIFSALQAAELIEGARSPATESIVAHLGRRLRVLAKEDQQDNGIVPRISLSLETQNPQAAIRLLDAMTTASDRVAERTMYAVPARVESWQGGSVTHGQLALLAMISSVIGFVGVWLAERADPSPILYTVRDVELAAELPVVVNLSGPENSALRDPAAYDRRCFRLLLGASELAIAAVFLLVVFHSVTQKSFSARFFADPLAACGEALTRVIG